MTKNDILNYIYNSPLGLSVPDMEKHLEELVNMGLVKSGELWRLITWLFIPEGSNL